MKKHDLEAFEMQLNEMKTELEATIARLIDEREAVSTSEDGVDLEDGISLENESKNEAALLKQQRHELEEVIHALSKIKNGTYGICEASEEAIPLARLKAIPHTRYCIEYQKDVER